MAETQAASTPVASPEATTATQAPAATEQGQPEVTQSWDGKLVVKINGVEEPLDLNDPDIRERVKAEYQISRVGREEMRRAKEALKKIQQFEGTAKQNPIEALKMMGVSEEAAEKVFEEWYLKRRDEEALPESEKKLRALQAENLSLKEQQELLKKQEEEARIGQVRGQMRKRLEGSVMKAMEAQGLPMTDKVYGGILKHIAEAEEFGYVDETGYPLLTPEEAIAHYKNDMKSARAEALQSAKIEEIIEELGPEKVNAIRQYLMGQVKKGPQVIPRDSNPTLEEVSAPRSKTISFEEARKQVLAKMGRG